MSARSERAAPPIRLLLVEDDPEDARQIRETLAGAPNAVFEVAETDRLEPALAMLQRDEFDVVVLDLTLPEGDGLDTLARAKVAAASVPVIAITADDDEDQAIRALRLGAQDYLIKGQSDPRLVVRSLLRAVERHRLIVDLQAARRREHYLATHDTLTGLPNRSMFQDQLSRSLEYAARTDKSLAVLFLDLDRFKNINDTLGHSVGDDLLVQVAKRLVGQVRKSDMVARLGGDEFIIMLQGVNRDYAPIRVAEQLVESFAKPFVLDGRDCWVTASVGVAIFPEHGTDPDALNRNADTAMYAAKALGRDRCQFYTESMNAIANRRMLLESRLRLAFQNSELRVHYQPRIDIQTGEITGAEALLRWTDPELGDVPPEEFVRVAEETGLIIPIGEWVLAEACAQMRAWQLAGFPSLRISVNISAVQLRVDALREATVNALWETGLDPHHLEFELTESTLIGDPRVSVACLRELKEIGVTISLDDFGTGFSSLSYLKRIPVDTVKIDYSFIRDMLVDGDDAAIVAAIISISEKLRLRVVAEGVETEQQRTFLRDCGCDELQGFLFSRPLPADEFLELLRSRRGD